MFQQSARARLGVVVAGLLLTVSCNSKPPQSQPSAYRTIHLAAAANLQFALDDVIAAFGREHPGITVKMTPGSSGNLRTQILNKAPFDIFLSADTTYPQEIIDHGAARPDAMFVYAIGRIVLWAPKQAGLDLHARGIEALHSKSVRKIVIANPKVAPYGRAAAAAFKKLGVDEVVKDRLVLAESIAQAAQFVESGAADVGVLALALTLAPKMKDQGDSWEVPPDAYPRMEQAGLILPWARDAEAARQFRDFLLGEQGQAVLARYGFFPPTR